MNKATVLIDNRPGNAALEVEHGLSVLLELEKEVWLLDTGSSDAFIRNAEALGLDLKRVDRVFISHGHSDHIGGLKAFLAYNDRAEVYLSPAAINQEFYSSRNGIHSISTGGFTEEEKLRFRFVEAPLSLPGEVKIFKTHVQDYPTPSSNRSLLIKTGQNYAQDPFNHELVFAAGAFLYTGCAHKGVLNILAEAENSAIKPSQVMGGFHLPDSLQHETKEEVQNVGALLLEKFSDRHFLTGHCTGNDAICQLEALKGLKIESFFTGYKIVF